MNRTDFVLAGLYTPMRDEFGPVQVQKLFFLIDKSIAPLVEGPYFNFEPYNYGPFDKAVYEELDRLLALGRVECNLNGSIRTYRLTEAGHAISRDLFNALEDNARNYIERASDFVRKLSFQDLVKAIYKAYPEMRAKSVFQG